MAKQNITKLLHRIERDINKASGFLEDRGFDDKTAILDEAIDRVQDVREALESLKEAA